MKRMMLISGWLIIVYISVKLIEHEHFHDLKKKLLLELEYTNITKYVIIMTNKC